MTKTTDKITKKDRYNQIIAILTDIEDASDLIDFCEHEIELLDKKSAKAKATAADKKTEADPMRDAVQAVLTADYATIADITAALDESLGATTSKVSYRLNALVDAGVAESTQISVSRPDGSKGKVKAFRLVTAD